MLPGQTRRNQLRRHDTYQDGLVEYGSVQAAKPNEPRRSTCFLERQLNNPKQLQEINMFPGKAAK